MVVRGPGRALGESNREPAAPAVRGADGDARGRGDGAGVALLIGPRVPNEGQHIRFSYAASNEAIEKGIARMADFIRANTRKAA